MNTNTFYQVDETETGGTICFTKDKNEAIEAFQNVKGNYSIKVIISGELVDVYENVSEEEFRELL